MTAAAPAILYGCADAECGYKTAPSTMGTPYAKCPLCGGRWVEDPPPQLKDTGRTISNVHNGKTQSKIVVRPHLFSLYVRLCAEKGNRRKPA